jgi:hypothetical protein
MKLQTSTVLIGPALLLFSLASEFCNASVFQTAKTYQLGSSPFSVATGDFNGDGKPDLAVSSIAGLTILIGKGDGTFQPANTTASPLTLSIASADFNGDHLDDLVGDTSSGIAVVLSNGDGTFGSPKRFAITANPVRLVAGDFNGDHLMDLAVTGYSGGAVSIFMGNGDGTFQTHVDYATGPSPTGIAVGDLNNDGKLDLVTTSRGAISALLGNGDGTFQSAMSQTGCTFPSAPFIADINEDSKPDVVNGCGSIQPHPHSTAQIRLGNGDGTFRPATGFGSGFTLAIADFNGDRHLDIVTADSNVASAAANLFLGNGDGTFQSALSLSAGQIPSKATIADLDGDNAPDLIVANVSQSGVGADGIAVLLNSGTDFSISAAALAPSSIRSGQSATTTVSLDLLNAFNNPVSLTCTVQSSAASPPTCALNPNSVTFDANGKAVATLTVIASSVNASLNTGSLHWRTPYLPLLPIVGLLLLVAGCGRRGRTCGRSLAGSAVMGFLFAGLMFQAGCGAGTSSTIHGSSATVTVKASSGATQHSTAVALTIE